LCNKESAASTFYRYNTTWQLLMSADACLFLITRRGHLAVQEQQALKDQAAAEQHFRAWASK
jgi:hypothetical protein